MPVKQYWVHLDGFKVCYPTMEQAEECAASIAQSRSEGQGKERWCEEYDNIEIEVEE